MTFHILKQPDNDIFSTVMPSDRKLLRKFIVSAILQTDMALHFELMTKFESWVKQNAAGPPPSSESSPSPSNQGWDLEGRMLVINVMLHCADLSNPVRDYPLAKVWASRLNEEFRAQVRAEQRSNLPISQMMAKSGPIDVAQREVNFIDFVIMPCWSSLSLFLPDASTRTEQAKTNRQLWLARKQKLVDRAKTESPPALTTNVGADDEKTTATNDPTGANADCAAKEAE